MNSQFIQKYLVAIVNVSIIIVLIVTISTTFSTTMSLSFVLVAKHSNNFQS